MQVKKFTFPLQSRPGSLFHSLPFYAAHFLAGPILARSCCLDQHGNSAIHGSPCGAHRLLAHRQFVSHGFFGADGAFAPANPLGQCHCGNILKIGLPLYNCYQHHINIKHRKNCECCPVSQLILR